MWIELGQKALFQGEGDANVYLLPTVGVVVVIL